jgi:putative ABC transport system permease protein
VIRAGEAARLYRFTLRAFPPRHRKAFADDMVETFLAELSARAKGGNGWRVLWFVVAACVNSVVAGLGERRRQRRDGFTPATGFSTLDFVLAWRIMLRYPGLSVIGVFGMAVGIAIAAGAFTVISTLTTATLPLPDGERIVSLMNWDVSSSNREERLLNDLSSWRGMRSLEDMGVSRNALRTLIEKNNLPETLRVAEISASAFRVAGIPAFRGRHLVPDDERPGAPEVIVVAHNEWVRRFNADPDIVGRSLQLGSSTYTVVGVMPEGFAFPVNHHFWIPWRLDPAAYQPRRGPQVNVFAKLAPGVTLESAQAELTAIGQRASHEHPATHEHLRAQVLPYTYGHNDMGDPLNALALRFMQAAIVLLLVVVCVNVAILVYARTASRQGEIAVRAALGASRHRIVAQLFAEALMLAGVAAAIGIGLLSVSLRLLNGAVAVSEGELPFWMSLSLSPDDIAYIVGLTLLSAAIVGVAPALKATGRHVHAGLQGLSPGSGSKMQMGWLWTALIVAQVALTVALLPVAMYYAWFGLRPRTDDAGFASRHFISASLLPDPTLTPPTPAGEALFRARNRVTHQELERRLEANPAIGAVTFSMANPGGERALIMELEGQPVPDGQVNYNIVEGSKSGHLVRFNRVAPDFFAAFDVPLLMGRSLQLSDTGGGESAVGVLVNRSFADLILGGANPLGHRLRYVGRSREADARDVELNRWFEVVGVVADFPQSGQEQIGRVYHAVVPGEVYPSVIAARVQTGEPAALAGTLYEAASFVDPNLHLRNVVTPRQVVEREQGLLRLIGFTVAIAMLSVVVLSAAGIYALMSFTVARRRREIGIRTALGANRNRILVGIFSRALGQLASGALAGMLGAVALTQLLEEDTLQQQGMWLVPAMALFMMVVGLLAALEPARRGLNIQPTEALREE